MKLILFADDTNILFSGDTLNELLKEITTEISKLKIWFNSNKLSLNLNKSKVILFGNNKINTQINIQIDGVIIERVKEIKFLGTIIDEKLSWKSHIKNTKYRNIK